MRRLWKCGLGLSLGLLVSTASAQDVQWRPAGTRPLAVVQATDTLPLSPAPTEPATTPAVTLGRPVVLGAPRPLAAASTPIVDPQLQPAWFGSRQKSEPVASTMQSPDLQPMPVGSNPVIDGGVSGPIISPSGEEMAPSPTPIGPTTGMAQVPGPVNGKIVPLPSGPIVATDNCPDCCTGTCSDCCSDPCMDCGVVCDDCNCCDCGNGCWNFKSRAYVSPEYMLWWLKDAHLPPLVTANTQGNSPSLGTAGTVILFGGGDYNSGTYSGLRATAGYWICDDQLLGIEGSGFFLGQRSTQFNASSNGNSILGRPFIDAVSGSEVALLQGFPTVPMALSGTDTVTLTTRFYSAEADLRSRILTCCNFRLDLLGGFRFLGLDEGLVLADTEVPNPLDGATFASSFLTDQFATRNTFYGGQLGVSGEYHWRHWVADGTVKVAMGDTVQVVNITGATRLDTVTYPGGLLAQPTNIGHFTRDMFTVVPEIGVNVGYQITDNLRAYVGFNFLDWSNVVRPGDQIDRVVNQSQLAPPVALTGPARPAFAFQSTNFFAYGVNIGLRYEF